MNRLKLQTFGTLLFLQIFSGRSVSQVITTVVGTDYTFPVDGKQALTIPLGQVLSICSDLKGNLYVANAASNAIWRIGTDGIVRPFAGNGLAGFSGDGGMATSASLNGPTALATDTAGNLFFVDFDNLRVRKIATDGVITTFAGNGKGGSNFFGNCTDCLTGDGGPATQATVNFPTGLALDSVGNLFIADRQNNVIREVNTNGIITTVAGGGPSGQLGDGGLATQATLVAPSSVAIGPDGGLYIFDAGHSRIRKVLQGTISTVAGNGSQICFGNGAPTLLADLGLNTNGGIAFSPQGQLYMWESCGGSTASTTIGIGEVLKISSNGTPTIVAGNGVAGFSGDGGLATQTALAFEAFSAGGIAFDTANNLYIADTNNNRIRKVNAAGTISTIAGSGGVRARSDGGPAQFGFLYSPARITFTAHQELLIADELNNCIRMIDKNGIITTIAGTGLLGFAGDGGPATLASLANPTSIAVDSTGNIYIGDAGNNRIRKIDQSGTISTFVQQSVLFGHTGFTLSTIDDLVLDKAANLYVADGGNNRVLRVSPTGAIVVFAGNGNGGFTSTGDGGPAIGASMTPGALAFDSAGNLLIADAVAGRIRKVDSAGTISTIAGQGGDTFSGDGGPALQANFGGFIRSIFVDARDRIYVTSDDERIRQIDTTGIISTVVGSGIEGFAGDGGSAVSAALNLRNCYGGMAADVVGNLYFSDCGNSRIRDILLNSPHFPSPLGAGPQSLSLSQASGGKPVTAILTAITTIAENSSISIPGMAYTTQVSSDAPWLSVTPQNGSTPGLLTVKADPLNLAPGAYQGLITIFVPLAIPPMQTITVQFNVSPGVPPAISIDRKHLSFTYATTSLARSQTIVLSNSGGGSLNFTTSISLGSGQSANWLSIAPSGGTATPDNPVSIAVSANPSNLPPGTYTGSVTIQGGSAGSVTLPVTMTITTNPHVLLLSQTGLTFTAVQNGGAIPPQTFGVLNLGSGTLGWTVQTSTLTGGNWLSATPGSGSSDAASSSGAPLVTVSINPAGLQPNIYYGLVKVVSAGAANTPQEVVAVLRVLAPNTPLAPIVLPSSLIFTSPVGVSSPSSQNLLVYDPTGTNKSFRSAKATLNGGSWFVTLPGDGTITAGQPASIVVQPIVNSLAAGVYTGTLTLEFSDGSITAVPITFVVTAGPGGGSTPIGASLSLYGLAPTQNCAPSKLLPALTTLSAGFNVPANFPQQLIAQIVDDCGTPLTQGKVSVEFTTGQPIQYMDSLSNGRWDLTWQTSAPAPGVTLTLRAEHPTLPITGSIQITGGLGATQPRPMVNDNGVVSAASGKPTPVAPGGIITIYGSALSAGTGAAPVLPLPMLFNDTTVTLGDFTLPLFYTSDGLLNALVPYGINTNTNMSLLVQRENSYANVVRLNVASAQPEVFQYGTQQGIAVDLMGNLIGPSNPAHAGEALVVYCAGLGAVTPPVADGAAAGPSSTTTNPVSVTIDGKNTIVASAGLTPGLPGLYQINLTVPQGVTPGDHVPVVVTVAGQASSVVFFSVR